MKNTDRLSKEILAILRYRFTGDEKGEEKRKDDDINIMTPNEIFREWLSYRGIIGQEEYLKKMFMGIFNIDEDMLMSSSKYRVWCCWLLDEEEILHAMEEVEVPVSLGLDVSDDNKEAFIGEVIERFKNSLSTIFDEWEDDLMNCVIDTVESWQDREG